MQLKIEVLSGDKNNQCLKDIVQSAISAKGFHSQREFARAVAAKTKNTEAAEAERVSQIILGNTMRISPDRAKAYAQILGIPEKNLTAFGTAGNYHHNRQTIIIDEDIDVATIVQKLSKKVKPTLEDLVKELLFLGVQV